MIMEEKNKNSVICVLGSKIYKLGVIDKDCDEPEKVFDKILEEVLCDYPDYRFTCSNLCGIDLNNIYEIS